MLQAFKINELDNLHGKGLLCDFDNNIKYKNLPELSSTDVQRTVVEGRSLLAAAWEAAAAVALSRGGAVTVALSWKAVATATSNLDSPVPLALWVYSPSPKFKALSPEAAAAVALSGGVLRPQQQFRTVPQ